MNDTVDVVIVTALPIERDAVLNRLDGYVVVQHATDAYTYYRARVETDDGDACEVAVVMLLGMGNNEAAIATSHAIERWRSKCVLMCGIGAGVPNEIRLGDVAVAEYSYYYELAKLTEQGAQRRGQQFPSDRFLLDRARAVRASEWQTNINAKRPVESDASKGISAILFGPIASGEKVVADTTTLNALRHDVPKLIALAMEGAGVARAAASAFDRPRFLEVRGISDYANPDKNDAWHIYAASAAAAFIITLLRANLFKSDPKIKNRRHNLPVELTPFVGRETEVIDIQKLCDTSRLVTLTGSGGVGKTRLALQLGRAMLEKFADGVWWVELETVVDATLAPLTLATVLGITQPAGGALNAAIIDFLRDKQCLIIFDNCEHLIEASALQVERLLRACLNLKIICTSREPLRIGGETIYRVPSLSAPHPAQATQMSVEELTNYEAIQFFVDRARAVQPNFEITQENAKAIAQLCYRLDGIPLAIELAAARVKALSVDKIAARLDDRFRLLTGGSRTALPRQQTLRAAIEWSHDLLPTLPPAERALLRRLSVFVGGCSLEAIESVCVDDQVNESDVLDLVTQLVDKSLLIMDDRGSESRYLLLETIRDFAREKLREANETSIFQARHFAHYAELARFANSKLKLIGAEQNSWLNRLEADLDNLRAGLEFAIEMDPHQAIKMAAHLGEFWDRRGHFSEGRLIFRRFIETHSEKLDGALDECLMWDGVLATRQGDYEAAKQSLNKSLLLSRANENQNVVARALHCLATIAHTQGDDERTSHYLVESLEVFRQLDDKGGIADSQNLLGKIAWDKGDLVGARNLLEEGLAMFRAIGDEQGIAKSLGRLGGIAFSQGDHLAAQNYLEESLAMRKAIGDRKGVAFALSGLGAVAWMRGNYEQAHKYYEDCLPIAREMGDKDITAHALDGLGNVACSQRDFSFASACFEECMSIRQTMGNKEGITNCIDGFARVALGQGRFERAACLFASVQNLRASIQAPLVDAEQAEFEKAVAKTQTNLDQDAFDAAWSKGSEMGFDEVIAFIRS
jgi:non-specific serine/threonine protein kinase